MPFLGHSNLGHSNVELLYKLMVRVARLILSLCNGTKEESANNLEHRGTYGDEGVIGS